MWKIVLTTWSHKWSLFIIKSQVLAILFPDSAMVLFMINFSNYENFPHNFMAGIHLRLVPSKCFLCCSKTPSVVRVYPRVPKSVESWLDGRDCQWTRLLPGVGFSSRDIRQNSVAGHIFLCFLREARQVVPLGFSICISLKCHFLCSISLFLSWCNHPQEPVSKYWKYSYLILIPSLELKNNNNNNNKTSHFSAQFVCLSNFIEVFFS